MFPIRDDAPKSVTPWITYFLILLNVAVFFFEITLGRLDQRAFVFQFGLVPAQVTNALAGAGAAPLESALLPFLTSMFLHGGWLHLIANMWALFIFGDNIEDHVGHFPYLLLYLVSGVAASALHVAFNQDSNIPSVGASGAIGGVMGAYFLLFPSARVLTVVPIIFYLSFVWLPAWLVLGFWFVAQFLSGAATSLATQTAQGGGGIAFWAHVGGFLAGVALIKLFPSRPRPYKYDW